MILVLVVRPYGLLDLKVEAVAMPTRKLVRYELSLFPIGGKSWDWSRLCSWRAYFPLWHLTIG